MDVLLRDIGQLVCITTDPEATHLAGPAMQTIEVLENAYLAIDDGKIHDFGKMDAPNSEVWELSFSETYDCSNRIVLPGYVDSHTHLVFPTTREKEFQMRLKGKSYLEIAAEGGGILNSAKSTAQMTEEDLFYSTLLRLEEIIRLGTTAVEIKSGYGLDPEAELKLLRAAQRVKEFSPIPVRTTLLALHALPEAYRTRRAEYISRVINELIPKVAEQDLAEYIDVFCEKGFFTVEESEQVLEAGKRHGLIPKVHANELDYSGGVQLAARVGARSADHLECVGDAEIEALSGSEVMPTLLPATAFFLGIEYAPARKMIDAGLPVALASDYNPGTSPSGNMNFVVAAACAQMKMLPEEALTAACFNAAYALNWSREMGSIAVGKKANVLITEPAGHYSKIPYNFGRPIVEHILIGGEKFEGLDLPAAWRERGEQLT